MKTQNLLTVSLTFLLSISGVNIVPFSPTSSLFNTSKAEAAMTIRNDYVRMDMPQTGNQDDNWSCGPTSAARLLNFYGNDVDRNTVVGATDQQFIIPARINKPWPSSGHWDVRTGVTPHVLRDVIKQWEGDNVKLERRADFNTLLGLLRQGKPVLVLLRVGSIKVAGTTWPAMHWVVVNGFSASGQGDIYYTETVDGETYQYSYDEFQSMWDWKVGEGLANESIRHNGVEPKTMIWVDRVPPVVAQSQAPKSTGVGNVSGTFFPGDPLPSSYAQMPMFDPKWYLEYNPDVNNACKGNYECAKDHYLKQGLPKECRKASPYFDPHWYLENNPDVKRVFVDCRGASEHWSGAGRAEKRPGASGVPAP